MAKRSSLQQVTSPEQLSNLDQLVVDKRYGKRAKAKKARRNRHYEKQFLRNAVSSGLLAAGEVPGGEVIDTEHDENI